MSLTPTVLPIVSDQFHQMFISRLNERYPSLTDTLINFTLGFVCVPDRINVYCYYLKVTSSYEGRTKEVVIDHVRCPDSPLKPAISYIDKFIDVLIDNSAYWMGSIMGMIEQILNGEPISINPSLKQHVADKCKAINDNRYVLNLS